MTVTRLPRRLARPAAPARPRQPPPASVSSFAAPRRRTTLRWPASRGSTARRASSGDVLVAEIDDEIVAAVPFAGGRAIADPFRPTADVVELLHAHTAWLAPRRARGRRFSRLPRVRVAA